MYVVFLFLVPLVDRGFNAGNGVDGRVSGSKSRRARPRSVSNKRCRADLSCGTASTQSTRGVVLVFGSDGCG